MARILVAGWLITLAACSLQVDGGAQACKPDGSCPTGLTCDEHQFCVPAQEVAALGCALAVAGGDEHSCAIRGDGTAWCWGRNDNGQLGDNTTMDRVEPTQVAAAGMPQLTAIAAGSNHTCALGKDGSVWCWGYNGDGELGNNSTVDKQTPVQVAGLTGATAIVAGDNHTCALLGGGSAACWGLNDSGQLGNGAMTSAFPSPQPVNLAGVTALAAHAATTCAIAGDPRELVCWGNNEAGQLGNGRMGNGSRTPVHTGVLNVAAVAVGDAFACAATASGAVVCAGDNGSAQLGNGSFGDPVAAFKPVTLTVPGKAIAAGDRFACVSDDQRRVWCWGDNTNGEYADGTFDTRAVPTRTPLDDAAQLAAGGGHLCVVSSTGAVSCSGADKRGQLGDGRRTSLATPRELAGLSGAAQVVSGGGHTCALLGDHTVQCWGINWAGQLGDGTQIARAVPARVEGVGNATQLVSGFDHVCALLGDHTVQCWGRNNHGQLGDSSPDDQRFDRAVAGPVIGLTGVTKIAAAGDRTCALASGAVQCWGALGGDTARPTAIALPVPGQLAIDVGVGVDHACAVTADHGAACWGGNDTGQLGTGDTTGHDTPVAVLGLTTADAIVGGDHFTCAHTTDGSVLCWGYDGDGQLADGSDRNQLAPKLISGLTGTAAIAAGSGHVCARKPDGALTCWGASYDGQVGTGVYGRLPTPAAIPGLAVSDVGLGVGHTCAVTVGDGHVLCWGDGRAGQLGDGVMTPTAPVTAQLTCP